MTLPNVPEDIVKSFYQFMDKTYALNASKKLSPNELIKGVYEFTDRYNKFVASFAVCQKGCAHCCYIDVQVKGIEALYIATQTGIEINGEPKMSLNHATPCPFLKNNECSIYNYRPFNCRTFHTLDDPKYCATKDVSHNVYGVANLGYGAMIYEGMAHLLTETNNYLQGGSRDIRDWFPVSKQE